MDTKALRQKILDLAIRGKLVPQDPNDEPASVLLERIRAEKQQMVKDGKLKAKDLKNDSVIFVGDDNLHYEKFSDGTIKCIQDDIPFKLPPRWEWCRLKSICSVLTDGTHQTPTYSDCGYVFLSSKNVTEGRIDWDNVMFIPENLHKELYTRIAPKLNDILLAKNGTTGVAAIVDKDCVFDIYVSLALIRIVSDIISPQYILNAIGSYFVQSFFKKSLKGIGVPNLHLERIRETLLPIPPYNEQIKITKTTNNLISLCEKIGSEKNSLSSLVTLAKNKILDLAIRGKLVSQDPNDEPASILLERIRKEKEELVKSGKLKRDKRESVIFRGEDNSYYEKFSDGTIKCIDDELPFKSPKNWMWCELQDCCSKEIKRGRAPKYADEGNVLAFAQKCNRKTGEIDISTALWLDRESTNRYSSDEYMLDGDIVINSTGTGTLGRIGIYRNNDNPHHIPIVPDSHVTVVRAAKNIEPSYLFFYLKFMQRKIEEMGEGSTNQKELKPLTIQKIRLPIPPYEEQQRIVKLVHSLTRKLSSIEEGLTLMH